MSQFQQQPPPYTPPQYRPPTQPGDGKATAALVLGIVCLAIYFINWLVPFLEVIIGVAGIILASMARSEGNRSSKMTAGLVCSIIGVSLGGFFWVACFACATAPMCATCAAIPFMGW
ncbi:MAG: hypothetical protein FWE21_05385 [Defluviitaleaceae bacterium]|nr:hypothetical protein [Defluviitaleaceae bacterium]